MACIWNFLGNGMFFFPKMSVFSHIAQKQVKPVLAYTVDHVELIEPQEAVVLMIFWHFKNLRSIFSCNFGPFLEGLIFFLHPSTIVLNKILVTYNGSRVDRYVIVFCAILIRQMGCVWNFLGNGMFFIPKKVGFFTYCSNTGKTCFNILCGPRGVDRTPRSCGFDDFSTF